MKKKEQPEVRMSYDRFYLIAGNIQTPYLEKVGDHVKVL